jgi:hypothetical protein
MHVRMSANNDRIYTLLSALMVQIYQLRKTSPDLITTSAIKEQISICMQALEQVSKTWLVATMVHKLFENILGWYVPDAPAQETPKAPPFGITVGDLGAQTAAEYSLLNAARPVATLPVRTKPLTKGLEDYLEAALQITRSSASELRNSYATRPERPARQVNRPAPPDKGLLFLPEDEELKWDEEDRPRTPASTGLNPDVW